MHAVSTSPYEGGGGQLHCSLKRLDFVLPWFYRDELTVYDQYDISFKQKYNTTRRDTTRLKRRFYTNRIMNDRKYMLEKFAFSSVELVLMPLHKNSIILINHIRIRYVN